MRFLGRVAELQVTSADDFAADGKSGVRKYTVPYKSISADQISNLGGAEVAAWQPVARGRSGNWVAAESGCRRGFWCRRGRGFTMWV